MYSIKRVCMLTFALQVQQVKPDSKVHGANMGLIWGQQDPGGPRVGPMNFAIVEPILTRNRALSWWSFRRTHKLTFSFRNTATTLVVAFFYYLYKCHLSYNVDIRIVVTGDLTTQDAKSSADVVSSLSLNIGASARSGLRVFAMGSMQISTPFLEHQVSITKSIAKRCDKRIKN